MKQTAVEWLVEMLDIDKNDSVTKDVINQAKAMEKEQTMEDYSVGYSNGQVDSNRTAEQYYNETFKSESFCNCPKGKGIDFDENQKAYCIDCGKNINL